MKIHAFEGFRYTPAAGDSGELAAPPFDQIGDAMRDRLHAVSPYQFACFTRPVAAKKSDPYEAAAAVHDSWLEAGVVARDEGPAIYPYVIETPSGGKRLGLCCLVEVGREGESDLRPHELTVDKSLEDRLALLRATAIDPEPVMLLADDDGALETLLAEILPGLRSVASANDAAGNLHRLYRIDDPLVITRFQQALASSDALIADGHHRSKTAQRYAAEIGATADTVPASKMGVLTSVASRELTIDPIHRTLEGTIDLDRFAHWADRREVVKVSGGKGLARLVAQATQPSLGVQVAGRSPEVWQLDRDRDLEQAPEPARDLPVVILHEGILREAGFERANWTDGSVRYRDDPDEVFAAVESGEAGTAFYLPPMTAQAFSDAIRDGDVLPPKSTRFLPKLISGLVWVGHDAKIL